MKNKLMIFLVIILGLVTILSVNCSVSKEIKGKEGSQLWSENCGRCHNAPGASNYSSEHWEVIGTHMRMRAHITADETRKIVEFLQSAK
jgi:hypothetical protein